MSLAALLLDAPAGTAAHERTLGSLAAQSVAVTSYVALTALPADAGDYLVLVMPGTVLDVTACERAVWFLATRPHVHCVTGAMAGSADGHPTLASVVQLLVIRTATLRELLAPGEVLHAASAVALALGVRRATGMGAGWLAEPVIRLSADADVLAPVELSARAALATLEFSEASLVDMAATRLPAHPQQRLQSVTRPALEVPLAPATALRILALFQGFPMGGYTAFNADLLPRLAALGHAVTTCTTEWWRSDWRLDQVRASSPDIHHAHAIVPPMAVPAYIDWLIASRAIDVVLLSHTFLGLHLLPYLRARHPGVAFVDYVHTDWFEAGMYGSYASMAARWEGQLDAQLATSNALVQQLTDAGCHPAALRAAHIGIDSALWQHNGRRIAEVRASLGASASTLVLLFAGRVSPEKRPHLAVEVAAQLHREGHDVILVVAGGGPLIQATHARAMACGLQGRFSMLGELDEHTLRHVFASADVFIAPSEIEGISRSLYEAMAMGCIPVVSDVGGQRELVVPGAGALVNAEGDAPDRYLEAVRQYLDPAVRVPASRAARKRIVAHFDSRAMVTTVCETLQQAINRRRTRQEVLPAAMAEELAVLSLEIIRRHASR